MKEKSMLSADKEQPEDKIPGVVGSEFLFTVPRTPIFCDLSRSNSFTMSNIASPAEKPIFCDLPRSRSFTMSNIASSAEKGAGKKKSPEISSLWELFQPKAGEWNCAACRALNPEDKAKCVCCETPKAGADPSKKRALVPTYSGGRQETKPIPLWELFKPKAGEWNCEACRALNSEDKAKCVCCETPKPGANPSMKPALVPTYSGTGFGLGAALSFDSSTPQKVKAGEVAEDLREAQKKVKYLQEALATTEAQLTREKAQAVKEAQAAREALATLEVSIQKEYVAQGQLQINSTPRRMSQDKQHDQQQNTDSIQSKVNFPATEWQVDLTELQCKESDCIGTGGFGKVYKARWRQSLVAVKVLLQAPDEASVLAFIKEVEIFAKLRHPHISLFMGYSLSPYHAIITEFYSNASLWDALRKEPAPAKKPAEQFLTPDNAWPWSMIERIAYEMACGMGFLHSCSPPIFHRDLKSQNILLDKYFQVKISDFGLSKFKSNDTNSIQPSGTYQWMAPEYMQLNTPYTESADIYSFAVVCWELLTRSCPYEGMNQAQIVIQVAVNQARPVIPDWCPIHFKNMIMFSWRQDPNVRPTFSNILDPKQMPWSSEVLNF